MNNEELYKRILNKVCIHFGYDVAHDLEYLFLVKEQEIERLNNIINELEKDLDKDFEVYICNGRKAGKSIELGYKICQKELLRKLKELKEGK